MKDNLLDSYMNYKTSRLKKYGFAIMGPYDKFIEEVLEEYIRTYINSYYYLIFDTVFSDNCTDEVLEKELEGKKLEMLDDLEVFELIDSNEEYLRKRSIVKEAFLVSLFLVKLDKERFSSKEEIPEKLNLLLDNFPNIKKKLGERTRKLENLLKETFNTLTKFLNKDDEFYLLDYQLYKDSKDLVRVVLTSNVKALQDNYKKSLLERVYRDDKLKKEKLDLLISKYIKQFIVDSYNNKVIYNKYFIELDEYLFTNKKDIEKFLDMLNNPFLKRNLVLVLSNDSYMSCQSLFKKYDFSLACMQDFSHINDVNAKLGNLDNSNIYDYVVVLDYKSKDLESFIKYTCVNLTSVLFNKEG